MSGPCLVGSRLFRVVFPGQMATQILYREPEKSISRAKLSSLVFGFPFSSFFFHFKKNSVCESENEREHVSFSLGIHRNHVFK